MKRSTDRILTTHVGSLIRPAALRVFLVAKEAGWPLKRDPYVLETTVPGVFVAGDVRSRSIKRVASAVGEGSMAVSLIHEYLAAP